MNYLLIKQQEGDFYYQFTDDHYEEIIPAPKQFEPGSKIFSFTDDDQYWATENACSQTKCERYFAAQYGMRGRVINLSKKKRACYGTSQHRVDQVLEEICPGFLLLETLLEKNNLADQSGVYGIQDQSFTFVAGRSDNGKWTPAKLFLKTDSEWLIVNYVEGRDFQELGINTDNKRYFSFREIGEISHEIPSYPKKRTSFGLPTGKVIKIVQTAVWSTAGLTALWGVYQWTQMQALARDNAELAETTLRKREDIAHFLSDHLTEVSHAMSLDISVAFQDIEKLWRPGSKIDLLLSYKEKTYLLRIPLEDIAANELEQTKIPAEEAVVIKAISTKPENLILTGIKTYGQVNEIGLVFNPKDSRLPLRSLLDSERL